MKIYHYTTFATFLDHILTTGKLKFGDFINANDPKEFVRSVKMIPECGVNLLDKNIDISNIIHKKLCEYQYISCCIDKNDIAGYKIPSMWAHYGECHQGVCIEIDTDKIDEKDILFQQEVDYIDFKPIEGYGAESSDETLKQDVNTYITQNKDILFFSKFPCWKYEQEYRFIKLNETSKSVYIDISNAITAVYCGTKMNDLRYNIVYLLTSNSYKLVTIEGVLQETEHPYRLENTQMGEWREYTIKEFETNTGRKLLWPRPSNRRDYFKKIIPRFDQIFEITEK